MVTLIYIFGAFSHVFIRLLCCEAAGLSVLLHGSFCCLASSFSSPLKGLQ